VIGQPAPATQELADDLNTYFNGRRKLSDIDLRRLEKKAESLTGKIEYSEYYVFLGFIAALRQDDESVTRHFENALKLVPSSDTKILNNYLAALNSSGQHSEALTQGKNLVKKLNDNGELLTKIIEFAFWSGRFHEALTLLNQLESPQQCEWYQGIIDTIELVDSAHLDDDEAEQLQQLAFSLLKKNQLYFSGNKMRIVDDFIHYEIYVDLPIAQIPALDFELSLTFAEKLENMRDDVIVFEYKSVDTLKQ
jgi:hypothetical protein